MDGKSMFGDIKSKLGFGRKNDYEEFYEDYEEFEEGDDYGEYGYDESYERTSGSAYDPYDSVTTREPGERSRSRSSMPRLVSIDDVRARTAVPTLPDDDAPATRRVRSIFHVPRRCGACIHKIKKRHAARQHVACKNCMTIYTHARTRTCGRCIPITDENRSGASRYDKIPVRVHRRGMGKHQITIRSESI